MKNNINNKKENKVLILTNNESVYLKSQSIPNVNITEMYKKNLPEKILKILRHSLLVSLSLNDWKKDLDVFDTIITFDYTSLQTIKWIRKKYPNKRVVFYYLNSIATTRENKKPENMQKYDVELWTYNLHDSKKYNLKYNKQVLVKKLFEDTNNKVIYDLVFLGLNKGRDKKLKQIYNYCKKNDIKTYFYIPDLLDFPENMCKDEKKINYEKYIKIINESKAILDLVSKSNKGLTLRPLEAMFLNKKLVTNYQEINEYDFYDNNNVYILDKDTRELKNFLNQNEPVKWNEEIVDSYDIKSWIERFKKC